MDRRHFLLGAGAAGFASVLPNLALACNRADLCIPGDLPDTVGTRGGTPPLKTKLCLSDHIYDLMTLSRQDGQWVRGEAHWDFALYYGGGRTPQPFYDMVKGRCRKQNLWPGTRVINWFNCIDRKTGQWVRHWSTTVVINASGEYILNEYYTEPAKGFDDEPAAWPLPR